MAIRYGPRQQPHSILWLVLHLSVAGIYNLGRAADDRVNWLQKTLTVMYLHNYTQQRTYRGINAKSIFRHDSSL